MRRGNIPRKNVNNVLTDFLASSKTHVNKGRERSVYFYFLAKCHHLGFDKYSK